MKQGFLSEDASEMLAVSGMTAQTSEALLGAGQSAFDVAVKGLVIVAAIKGGFRALGSEVQLFLLKEEKRQAGE